MKKSDSILIFGAGKLQCSLIRTVKHMGYNAIAIDPDPNAIGQHYANEFIVVQGNDYKNTLNIATRNSVKGIVTSATDKPLIMMARIAKVLKLCFPSEASLTTTIDKYKLKQVLLQNNIPCAKGILVTFSEIDKKINQAKIDYPVIVKPIDSSGSRGVYYCKDNQELKDAFSNSKKYSNSNKVLVEEYLEGPELSIEALIQDKKLQLLQLTDKITTSFPYNVEMGHSQPSRFYKDYFDEIYMLLCRVTNALDLDNCALHPEIKITKKGIKIVEIGPRLGGDFITSHLTPLSTGINMEEQLVKIAVGEKINIERTESRFSSIMYFNFLNSHVDLSNFKLWLEIFKTNAFEFEIYYDNFSTLPIITNSLERHGHIILFADSIEKMTLIKQQILDYYQNN